MAIVNVSNQSELMRALNSADAGDRLVLEAGNYGSLSLRDTENTDYTFEGITIASSSSSNPAVFNAVNLANVTNVTFDGIKFDLNNNSNTDKPFFFNNTRNIAIVNSEFDGMVSGGTGTGQGLWVTNSSDFRLQNSEITNFTTASHFRSIDNLKVIDNSYSGVSYDGMICARIDGALIQGNTVQMKGEEGRLHRDAIQFWNNDINDPSSDIVIRGNTLTAGETVTHGIFISNDVARNGGGLDSFHRNILIENNTIKTGQALGLLVGETVGLTIRNNSVLQHDAVDSNRSVDIPVIRVDNSARDVAITGNTTHKLPGAADSDGNWQPLPTPGAWTIANNRIVPLGATGGSAEGGTAAPTPPADGGDGAADEFRYNGGSIGGQERVTFANVDFTEGDYIILNNFDQDTFDHYGGDNVSGANAEGTYLRINSLVDIQEIVTASAAVSAVFQTTNDTLVMRIVQDAGVLDIALPGLAEAYQDSFNANLF